MRSRRARRRSLPVFHAEPRLGAATSRDARAQTARLKPCRDGTIVEGEIIVGRSKTEAGDGRRIPFTHRACGALTLWLSRFSEPGADSYVFPFHHVGLAGNGRKATPLGNRF